MWDEKLKFQPVWFTKCYQKVCNLILQQWEFDNTHPPNKLFCQNCTISAKKLNVFELVYKLYISVRNVLRAENVKAKPVFRGWNEYIQLAEIEFIMSYDTTIPPPNMILRKCWNQNWFILQIRCVGNTCDQKGFKV